MANTVREIEVTFAGIEDEILDDLGYREYTITIDGIELTPKPEVIQKPLQAFSDGQIRRFIDNLGGQGNPITYFQVNVSRTITESTIRNFSYWVLTRDSYVATCLPVQFKVTDSRYEVLLGVIKQEGEPD